MSDTTEAPSNSKATKPGKRLLCWFAIGFLLVFLGMSLMVDMYRMSPSGQGVVRCSVWEYYLSEIPRAFTTGPAGPSSGGGAAAIMMLLQHLGMSAIGGVLASGVGFVVGKYRDKTKSR